MVNLIHFIGPLVWVSFRLLWHSKMWSLSYVANIYLIGEMGLKNNQDNINENI